MVSWFRRTAPGDAEVLAPDPSWRLPEHVAIIMDGNGRWAQARGLPRIAGHRAGTEALRGVVTACREWRIPFLTVYAFSTENWKRPAEEVHGLMGLLVEYLRREIQELHKNGIRIRAIGRWEELPEVDHREIRRAMELTSGNGGLVLNLALNYGGRTELVDACRELAREIQAGSLSVDEICQERISDHLYTAGMPDPDLLVRTGGEMRLSNFLLWQAAYSELWVTSVYWPDFGRKHLMQAISDYQKRERRFGAVNIKGR